MEPTIVNAAIRSASLSNADNGVLSSFVYLDYERSGQGFGGFVLYRGSFSDSRFNYTGHWIWRCMEVAGVTEWADLPGKNIRAEIKGGRVYRIGHIIKDVWFCPSEEFGESK